MKTAMRIIYLFIWLGLATAGHAQHRIEGVVKSGDAAVPAATVQVFNEQYSQAVVSDNAGRFTLQRVPEGEYIVTASSVGFASASRPVRISAATPQLVIVLSSTEQELNAVTVTHTRISKTDDLIDAKKTASPTLIIDKKTINAMGSRRLDEVLREQTGMAIVSDLGSGNRSTGLQMQGFSAEHILIMLNGLPLTGRFNGNFDLSRISVADVERIEVTKGASSSLYGSEALGGVVNIITRQDITATRGSASVLYGTYNTFDAGADGETQFAGERGGAYVSANVYRTDGFNANTAYLRQGQTSPPYQSYNYQARVRYRLNDVSSLQASARYNNRHSVMGRSYGVQPFSDKLREGDLNASLVMNNRFRSGWRLLLRYYYTQYNTDQSVTIQSTGHILQQHRFSQQIHRAEVQAEKKYANDQLTLTGGAGGDHQQMNNVAAEGSNGMFNYFMYAQANYSPVDQLHLIAGGRFDGNNVYGGRFNPSLGLRWKAIRCMTVSASLGQGYKAPTYAQLYQVFTNITQGYTVIGANSFAEKSAAMQQAGLIRQIWPNAARLGDLQPEVSTSWNVGLHFSAPGNTEISINGYYNNIGQLINTEQVGIMENGQQLFSYFNIASTFTRGLEASISSSPLKGFHVKAGYQYLEAKSQDVLDSISSGKGVYSRVRTESGIRVATPADYFGLPNRSKHMASLQMLYEYAPWGVTLSARATHRSKYGFLDVDNNGYIDRYDVFVKGYTLYNATLQKTLFAAKLTLKLSVDNIGNYTDYLMPSQPGRVVMGGLTWRFAKAPAEKL